MIVPAFPTTNRGQNLLKNQDQLHLLFVKFCCNLECLQNHTRFKTIRLIHPAGSEDLGLCIIVRKGEIRHGGNANFSFHFLFLLVSCEVNNALVFKKTKDAHGIL